MSLTIFKWWVIKTEWWVVKTPKTKQPLSSALWIRLVFIQKKKKKKVITTYPYVVSFLTLYPPVVYSVNALLPTSQSTVTLTCLIPKSKNETDQTLLSPSNTHTHTHTHTLSVLCFLTHWGCYPPEFLDLFMLGILWVFSSKETVELLNYWFRVLIVTNLWFFVNKLDLYLFVFLSRFNFRFSKSWFYSFICQNRIAWP